jgi:hypothetical protein
MLMAWEEGFGIGIPDEAAATLETPNHAIDYIAARLGARRTGPCRTQRAFHRVRAAFAAELGLPRGAVRPAARLSDLIPGGVPVERWRAVGQRVGAGWAEAEGEGAASPLPFLGWLTSSPERVHPGRRTVAGLVRRVAAHEPDVRPAPGQPWTREQVALLLRRITLDEAGVEDFEDDDEFVRDMGLD